MSKGTVKFFNDSKGFGFIVEDDNNNCVANTWPYYGCSTGTSFATPIVAGTPKTKTTAGATPTCAEIVAANIDANQRGPGTMRARGPDNKHNPVVAPTDM